MSPIIRVATSDDLPALRPVIERAYRGEASRAGWTHEADLIPSGERTDLATLEGIVADPNSRLVLAIESGAPIGCVHILHKGAGTAYLGLLCVDPGLQAGGLGKTLIYAAENQARLAFGARMMEMTVIDRRAELIAYYERRGYAATGETRDFPIAMDPPLFMTVLAKPIAV